MTAVEASTLSLNLDKCQFFDLEMELCGRLVKAKKWQLHDIYFEKVLKMGEPKLHHKPAQAVCVAGWLAPTISVFADWREKFSEYVDLKGKKLKKLAKLNLPVHWTPEPRRDWEGFREALVDVS